MVKGIKYPIGTKITCNDCKGIVVENTKLPGDVSVDWDHLDITVTYDEWWLDENVTIVKDK